MMGHVVVEHMQAQRPLRSYYAIALRETNAACRSLDRDAPAPRNHTKFRGRSQMPCIAYYVQAWASHVSGRTPILISQHFPKAPTVTTSAAFAHWMEQA
jgi:hypothetical protein